MASEIFKMRRHRVVAVSVASAAWIFAVASMSSSFWTDGSAINEAATTANIFSFSATAAQVSQAFLILGVICLSFSIGIEVAIQVVMKLREKIALRITSFILMIIAGLSLLIASINFGSWTLNVVASYVILVVCSILTWQAVVMYPMQYFYI